jgi:hypothetical protein
MSDESQGVSRSTSIGNGVAAAIRRFAGQRNRGRDRAVRILGRRMG